MHSTKCSEVMGVLRGHTAYCEAVGLSAAVRTWEDSSVENKAGGAVSISLG